ncbi:serpin family protein, partial [bacterium LRH843]|nr:serpin family protein [bacterium LRH843]
KELGVEEMFSDKANFSNINSENNIKVSKVIQKAFVSVDEKGTEAAAATGIAIAVFAAPRPPPLSFEFYADHPFLCLITKKMTATNMILQWKIYWKLNWNQPCVTCYNRLYVCIYQFYHF